MKCENRKRESNIELLRVVSMLFIVMSHYIFHGLKDNNLHSVYDIGSKEGIIDYFTMEPLWILSCVAVNCYVMISGYFLIDKPIFRWGGIIRVWLQTFFYSIVLLLFCSLVFLESSISIIGACAPVYSKIYWFVSTYIGLLLLAPILSLVVTSISKKSYLFLLVIYFIFSFNLLYGTVYSGFDTVLWFSYLFLVAGYIKMYGLPNWIINYRISIFIVIWVMLFVFATVLNHIKYGETFLLLSTTYDGPIFFLSVSFFILFVYMKDKKESWGGQLLRTISALSPYTFGVYLIHDHPAISAIIWKAIIPVETNMPIIIYMFSSVLTIYACCTCIDYIRSVLFKVVGVDRLSDYIASKMPQFELYRK